MQRPSDSHGRPRTVLVIPALDEEGSLPGLLAAIPPRFVDAVIVVDNGSADRTGEVAQAAGARVVREPERGYGAACLAGLAEAAGAGIVVFMDADASDDPAEIPLLLAPLETREADVVIGSRTLGRPEPGALLPQARWGNALAALLIRLLFGRRVTDLGPFRALTSEALAAIAPDDRRYGFPVQTQVRAIARDLRVVEVPVSYRRRVGRSKISGTFGGVVKAGWGILSTILREYARHQRASRPPRSSDGGA